MKTTTPTGTCGTSINCPICKQRKPKLGSRQWNIHHKRPQVCGDCGREHSVTFIYITLLKLVQG